MTADFREIGIEFGYIFQKGSYFEGLWIPRGSGFHYGETLHYMAYHAQIYYLVRLRRVGTQQSTSFSTLTRKNNVVKPTYMIISTVWSRE